MDPGVKGRTALVLGAGGGLGRAISVTLAVEGAQVAAADLVEDGVVQTAAAVERSGARALALTWDLADLGVIDAQVGRIEAELGPVDILVAITGGPPPG